MAIAGRLVGNVSLAANAIDYGVHISNGGRIGINPESLLFAGDAFLNRMSVRSPQGFILNVAWEAGKAGGRYKNYLERKYSPGGLDGLLSTPGQ